MRAKKSRKTVIFEKKIEKAEKYNIISTERKSLRGLYMKEISKSENKNIIRCRYSLIFFGVAVLYNFIFSYGCKMPEIGEVAYGYLLLNFDFGFAQKYLPGTVFGLFCPGRTMNEAVWFNLILIIIIFAGISFLLGCFISEISPDERKGTAVFFVLFLTSPASVSTLCIRTGILDIWWVLLSVPFIVCLQNRIANCFCFLFYLFAVMFGSASFLTYLPFFAVLQLYEIISEKSRKEKAVKTVFFFLSLTGSVALEICFLSEGGVFEKTSLEEISAYLRENGVLYSENILYSGYGYLPESFTAPDLFSSSLFGGFFNGVLQQFWFNIVLLKNGDLRVFTYLTAAVSFVLCIPLLVPAISLFKKRFLTKQEKGLFRFTYFCMLVFLPFSVITTLLASTDAVRWLAQSVTLTVSIGFYIAYRERENLSSFFSGYVEKYGYRLAAIYGIINCMIIFDPYA